MPTQWEPITYKIYCCHFDLCRVIHDRDVTYGNKHHRSGLVAFPVLMYIHSKRPSVSTAHTEKNSSSVSGDTTMVGIFFVILTHSRQIPLWYIKMGYIRRRGRNDVYSLTCRSENRNLCCWWPLGWDRPRGLRLCVASDINNFHSLYRHIHSAKCISIKNTLPYTSK